MQVVLLALLVGCGGGRPLPPVPPLDELAAVQLGMRAARFQAHRPNAMVAPYAGYQETVGAWRVVYFFDSGAETSVAFWKRLPRVAATQYFVGDSLAARQEWEARVRDGVRVLGVPDQCSRLVSGTPSVVREQVTWVGKGQTIEISWMLAIPVPYEQGGGNAPMVQISVIENTGPRSVADIAGSCGSDGLPANE